MVPFLVVFGLLLLGVTIVAWATRPTASYPLVQKRLGKQRRARVQARRERGQARGSAAKGKRRLKPQLPAQPEAFSSAPASAPPTIVNTASREASQ